jgi:hypothetical protein
MIEQYRPNEDRLPPKLSLRFSSKIAQQIRRINVLNKHNIEALNNWKEYLRWIKRYLSDSTIAWDNMGRYPRFPNGAIFIRDFGYNVACIIQIDNTTNLPYVYVFKVNLKPREFGLRENKNRINRIISEVIDQYLRQNLILN